MHCEDPSSLKSGLSLWLAVPKLRNGHCLQVWAFGVASDLYETDVLSSQPLMTGGGGDATAGAIPANDSDANELMNDTTELHIERRSGARKEHSRVTATGKRVPKDRAQRLGTEAKGTVLRPQAVGRKEGLGGARRKAPWEREEEAHSGNAA